MHREGERKRERKAVERHDTREKVRERKIIIINSSILLQWSVKDETPL